MRRGCDRAIGGGGERGHHARDAEGAGARVALAPAFGGNVHDRARATLLPVVSGKAAAVGTRCARGDLAGVERGLSAQLDRRTGRVAHRFDHEAAERHPHRGRGRERDQSLRGRCAAEQQVTLAAVLAGGCALGVPAEGGRRGLHLPRAHALGKLAVGAEHAVEKACGVRAHELSAQAVARRPWRALHLRALVRQPALADRRIGQERGGHDRLHHRRRHRVVKHRGIEQRVGAIADRIRHARVALAGAARTVVFLARAGRKRTGQRLDAATADVDDRDRGHADHRAFEQAVADGQVRVLLAHDAERAAHVLPARVARGNALRERLHAGNDGDIHGIPDVDERVAHRNAIGFRPRGRRRGAADRAAAAFPRATAAPASARRRAPCPPPARP